MASNQNDPAGCGDKFFVRKEYEKALEAYSTAIDQNPKMVKLYSNRALTYIKLERPYHALKDLEICLTMEPDNDKLIYRKCKVLLALRRFSDAIQFLDESNGLSTTNTAFKDRLKMEYERGQYDLPTMIEEATKSKFLDNHADYIASNKFEIRKVDGKGRGSVVTNKIDAGELLIACKAFVFVDTKAEVGESIDSGGALESMVEKVRKKLTDRPDLVEEFYRLYAGPKLGHLEKWTEGESKLIDEDRIKEIIDSNAFTAEDIFDIDDSPRGLWLIPSYVNHTCVDTNCFRYFVGDYIFIRATKPIEKGEEMLFPYVSPSMSFEKRQSACKEYGFDCQCRLCVVDRQDPIEIKQRMEEIFVNIEHLRDRANRFGYYPSIETLDKFHQELLQLRPHGDLNYLLLRVKEAMAVTSMNETKTLGLMTEYFNALISNGSLERALAITKIMYKEQVSRRSKGKKEQERWMEEARGIARFIYGDERMADLILNEG